MPFENQTPRTQALPGAFCVGPYLIEPMLHRVMASGEAIRVEPKVMEVLVYLAERPLQVVSRQELLAVVWAGTVVGDDALTLAISKLRKAFADDPRRPQVIETIPKGGYRLIAPVSPVYDGDSVAETLLPVETPDQVAVAVPEEARSKDSRGLWIGATVLVLMIVGIASFVLWTAPTSDTPVFFRPVPVTSMPGREQDAALSPDGHRVAFAWPGPDGTNADIYVKMIGTETPLRLTDDPAIDLRPVWAPDGERVAFLRYDGTSCLILVVPVVGGAERPLADCGMNDLGELAWSPDGQWLAYPDREAPEQPSSIYLLSLETLDRRQLTTPGPTLAGDHAPAFSPDGKYLSFMRTGTPRVGDLFVVPLEGGTPQQRTFDDRWIWGHTWMPDGERLLFSSTRSGFFNLWTVGKEGGAPQWVPVTGGESLINPMVAPASRRLVYEQWSYDANIWQRALADTLEQREPRPFMASSQWDAHPQFSPDGAHVAFTSRRSGDLEIWVCKADGSDLLQLTATGDSFASTMRWAPDGRRIVFSARQDDRVDLYVAYLEGPRIERLTTDDAVQLHPAWSRDGQQIYFASDKSGAWQIWAMSSAGGLATPVTEEGGIYASESATGTHLYFTRHNADGLWERSLRTGAETRIIETLARSDWGNWVVVEHGLYFVQKTEAGASLVFWNSTTRSSTPVITLDRTPLNPSLAVSPDGQMMLYAQMDRNESDLMVVDDFR